MPKRGQVENRLSNMYFEGRTGQGKATPPQKTPTQIKKSLDKQFAQTLSVCFLLIFKGKGGTVCTNCPEIVCANCAFIFGWVFFCLGGSPLHEQETCFLGLGKPRENENHLRFTYFCNGVAKKGRGHTLLACNIHARVLACLFLKERGYLPEKGVCNTYTLKLS